MGMAIREDTPFTPSFVDNRISSAEDEGDISYMFRKLQKEYKEWGLEINLL